MRPPTKVESRPRPPDETLMTDWPIMAQPPMPPNTAEAMLAMPWPMHSRLLLLGVSVMSSTICAVSSDFEQPDRGERQRHRRDDRDVASVNGTCGKPKLGSAGATGRDRRRCGRECRTTTVMAVSTAIATSGEARPWSGRESRR